VVGEAAEMKAFRSLLFLLLPRALHTCNAAQGHILAVASAWLRERKTARGGFEVMRVLAATIVYPLACVALTTGLLALTVKHTALAFDQIIYLIPVVICAIQWGRASAIVAIVATTAVVDFLWLPPVYSFRISEPRHIVELTMFVFVAFVTSHLATRLRSEVVALQRRENEVHNLYEFSRRLALCDTAGDLLRAIQDYLSVHLGCEAHLIHVAKPFAGGEDKPEGRVPQLIAQEASAMVVAREPGSRLVSEPKTTALWALKYIATTLAGHGVLAINLGKAGRPGIDKLNERIDALLSEASRTLTRIDAAAALAKANTRLESEVLRAALINMASHELRSPVAAILGSASVLDQLPALRDNEKMRSLVTGMHYEAERLDNDIQNLLDTVRLTDSGVRPHMAWADLADILGGAIRPRQRRIAAHRLTVDVDPELPLVNVDAVLLEQAVGQLIDNAAKYSPAGSEIAVAARADGGQIAVSVADTGVGLTEEEAGNLFHRSYRGPRHLGKLPGLGLGLWIARIFVAANGGTLSAHSPGPGQGTTMTIHLPITPPGSQAAPSSDG
jgi:two-component system sensor histidine kinase KdpD